MMKNKVNGIDVSQHQGIINWDQVVSSGILFAFIRSTFGLYPGDYDTQWKRNWAEAKRVGVMRGGYQFILSYQSITDQARLLVDRMDGDFGELPPVCDVEYWCRQDGKYESMPTVLQVKKWCETVEMLTGITPIIYSGGYWKTITRSMDPRDLTWALRYDHWLAQYTAEGFEEPCKPWQTWAFWQHTEKGDGPAIAGIRGNLDLNVFNGDLDAFADYTNNVIIVDPPEPEPEKVEVINCEWLSFRSRPEVYPGDRPAIGEGVVCTVLEKSDGWLYVELSGGDKGWISEKYTKKAG